MRKILMALAAVAISSSAVRAEKVWTLQECIDYAVEHNLTVQNQKLQQLQGELEVTEAKDKFLPSVNASASQSFNFGRGLTSENTYADRNTRNFQWGVNLDLPLFQGLSAVRQVKQSRLNLRSQLLQTDAVRDNVTLNVISQYLQVLYSREVLAASEEQMHLAEYELKRQKALAEAGKIAEVDVLQAESQLAADRQTVVDNQDNLTLARLELVQLLRLDSLDGFDIAAIEDSEPMVRSAEDVFNRAMGVNYGILKAQNDIDVARASKSVAQTGYIPKLSFNAGIGSSYYKVSGFENKGFSGQMRDNLNKYLGFSLSIPVFNAFSTRNQVRRANVSILTARLQLDDTRSQLYHDIQQAYYRARGARDKYLTGVQTEEISRKTLEAMKEKYELGRSTPAEFEQTKTQYYTSRISTIQSHYEYILRCSILDFYAKDREPFNR